MTGFAGYLNGLSTTGSCKIEYTVLKCTSSAPSSQLQVFKIPGWNGVRDIDNMNVPAGATVVFIVQGQNIDFGNFGTSKLESVNAIFYFPDATSIKTYNVALIGGFLAPNAIVNAESGQMRGWIYAKSVAVKYWKTAVRPFKLSCQSKSIPLIHQPQTDFSSDLSNWN